MLQIDNIVSGKSLYCVFVKSTGNPQNPYDGYVTPVGSDGTTCTAIARCAWCRSATCATTTFASPT